MSRQLHRGGGLLNLGVSAVVIALVGVVATSVCLREDLERDTRLVVEHDKPFADLNQPQEYRGD